MNSKGLSLKLNTSEAALSEGGKELFCALRVCVASTWWKSGTGGREARSVRGVRRPPSGRLASESRVCSATPAIANAGGSRSGQRILNNLIHCSQAFGLQKQDSPGRGI